jgi:hypothetical protein
MNEIKDSGSQLDRFKEVACDIGADESEGALDRVMGKLDLKKKPEAQNDGRKAREE